MTELASAVLAMAINGTDAMFTLLAHGGAELPGAHTPLGTFALAVLLTTAGGLALAVAATEYVTNAPDGNVAIVSLTEPLPLAAQVAPPLPAQVQVCDAMPAGTGSLTVVPSASTAPLLFTVMV